jgi:hypothetical protein
VLLLRAALGRDVADLREEVAVAAGGLDEDRVDVRPDRRAVGPQVALGERLRALGLRVERAVDDRAALRQIIRGA